MAVLHRVFRFFGQDPDSRRLRRQRRVIRRLHHLRQQLLSAYAVDDGGYRVLLDVVGDEIVITDRRESPDGRLCGPGLFLVINWCEADKGSYGRRMLEELVME